MPTLYVLKFDVSIHDGSQVLALDNTYLGISGLLSNMCRFL